MKLYDGFLNLLKPPGMTSHDVVALARRHLGLSRVGHLGTLDPAAAGVLPVSLGRATRLFQFAAGPDKAYRAEVVLGITTDTLDAEGRVTGEGDASAVGEEQVRQALAGLIGEITQRPPAYSAVQVNGKRLHALARIGMAGPAPPRRVRITSVALAAFRAGRRATALLDIVCSPGTFVRSLAADLGQAVGCPAYLGFLVRTRAGRFELSEALGLEEFIGAVQAEEVERHVLPPDWPLVHLPAVELDHRRQRIFMHGGRVLTEEKPTPLIQVFGPGSRLLGIGEVISGGQLRPCLVLASPAGPAGEAEVR